MANNQNIVALDLGGSRITLIEAEVLKNDVVRIIGMQEVEKSNYVRNGILEQVSGAAHDIYELVRKMEQTGELFREIKTVYTSINGKTLKNYVYSIERSFRNKTLITKELLAEMENECAEKYTRDEVTVYDLIPLEYKLNNVPIEDPEKKKGHTFKATYNVIVGNKVIYENLERCFDRTGFKLNEYTSLAMEAISEAVLTPEDCEDGTALILFGATTTALGIYTKGALEYLQVVPLGSYNISKDIQEIGISEENAEKLKRHERLSMPLEKMVEKPLNIKVPNVNANAEPLLISTTFLANAIEARLDEIFLPIFETIEKYRNSLGAGIVLTGGGANQNGILDYFEDRMDMYVRLSNHSRHLAPDTDKKILKPQYAQIVGTVLLADIYNKQHPEFEIAKKKKEGEREKQPIGNAMKQKLTEGFMQFFNFDNKM
jgi:cell division protein FtsA